MIRQLVVLTATLVDAAAAFLLGGPLCGVVVCAAGGWATAQYDPGYAR